MAKAVKVKKTKKDEFVPFDKQNYFLIGAGIVCIVVGYVALLEKTVEGFLPLFVAPVLLVLGYCVLIPLGILYTRREKEPTVENSTSA